MKKEYKEQIEQLEREIAEAAEPEIDKYMELYAMYRFLKEDKDKSNEVLRKALELQTKVFAKPDIDYIKEGLNLVHIYQSMEHEGMVKLTCEKLLAYLKEQPQNAETFEKYGDVYRQGLEDNQVAKSFYEKAFALNPERQNTIIGLFDIYTDHLKGTADKEKAVEFLNLLKKVAPGEHYIEFAQSRLDDFDREAKLFSDMDDVLPKADCTRVILDSTTSNPLTESDIKFLQNRDWASYILLAIGLVVLIVLLILL